MRQLKFYYISLLLDMFPFTAPLNNKLRYNQGSYLGLISLPSPCKASRTPRVYDGCHATGNSAG